MTMETEETKKHICFICNNEFDFWQFQTKLEPDGVISFGYGSKFDSLYLFPLTSWMVKKIKSWGIKNSPITNIPICDDCVDRCTTLGHASIREKPPVLYSLGNSTKYEYRDPEQVNLCISFNDIITDYDTVVDSIFYGSEIDVKSFEKDHVEITLPDGKELKVMENNHLIIKINGDQKIFTIVDSQEFKNKYYKD